MIVTQETTRGATKNTLIWISYLLTVTKCSRVEWTTDKGNVLSENFYERLGVPKNQEKIFYRLEGEGIRRMAESRR